jgi:hypothetical protein
LPLMMALLFWLYMEIVAKMQRIRINNFFILNDW